MNNYKDYEVMPLDSFTSFCDRIFSFGESVAFVNRGEEITYAKFAEDVARVKGYFMDKGRYVLVCCADKYKFIVAYFATVLSGNIACLQPYLSGAVMPCFADFDFLVKMTDEKVDEALKLAPTEEQIPLDKYAMCTVLHSSGTTSTPKAVALSGYGMIIDTCAGMRKYEFADGGVFVNILPYSHAFGVVCDLFGPLYSRSTIYFAYSIPEFIMTLPKANPTALNIIPALASVLCKQIENAGSKEAVVGTRLRKILSGGAGTPASLCERMEKFGIAVCGCYGLSECSPCVSVNRDGYNKYGSAGVLLDCNDVEFDEAGEITVVGKNIMIGYLDASGNLTPAEVGRYRTGDLGYKDEDGFLYIVGRADDMMVFSNGIKLMPNIVEGVVAEYDGVAECAAYEKDDRLTIKITVTDERFESALKEKLLGSEWQGIILSDVICTTEPLPRNALGKLNRKLVKG